MAQPETEVPSPEQIESWHRLFAIDCNNSAWNLVEKPNRTSEENAEMLRRAYAAAYHWFQVGTEVHKNRAESLLAQVHASLGHKDLALHYAKRNFDFVMARPSDPWEVAFAHSILAHAAAIQGLGALHADHYHQAEVVAAGLDEGDRKVFMATFVLVPKP